MQDILVCMSGISILYLLRQLHFTLLLLGLDVPIIGHLHYSDVSFEWNFIKTRIKLLAEDFGATTHIVRSKSHWFPTT